MRYQMDQLEIIEGARQGDALYQATLGTMYWKGEGVKRSLVKSIYWYEKAQFVDWAAVDSCDPAPANYAGLCEVLLLDSLNPLERFFMRRVRWACAVAAEYGNYKEPHYILLKARQHFGKLRTGLKETTLELLLIVAPMILLSALLIINS